MVTNILFIHKSWQQIRHGDAHDSRTQNSKAVQKNKFVFTVRMCVCLPFLSNGQLHWRLFLFRASRPSPPRFDIDLTLFSWRHCYATSTFLRFTEQQVLPVRLVLSKWHALICEWLAEHFHSSIFFTLACESQGSLGKPWWNHALPFFFFKVRYSSQEYNF